MHEEVYLRPLTVEDAAVSWRWRNDADLWRFTASRPNVVVNEEIERSWATNVISDPSRLNFAICLKPSNRYIGNVYLVNIKNGVGELGIFIGEKGCHGKGYAQAALSLLKKAAADHGIKTIRIGVNKDNLAALVVYLKAGGRIETAQDWINLTIDLSADDLHRCLCNVSSDSNLAASLRLSKMKNSLK